MGNRDIDWQEYEDNHGIFFIKEYDSEAKLVGGSNCYAPDIISPKFGNGEIKEPEAQFGQFSASGINDTEYNQYIASKSRSEVTNEDAKYWCKCFYRDKGTNFFLSEYKVIPFEQFFEEHTFFLQNRETKGNGSGPITKQALAFVPKEWEPYYDEKENKWYCPQQHWNKTTLFTNTKGDIREIWVSTRKNKFKKQGELRILSNKETVSWMFSYR